MPHSDIHRTTSQQGLWRQTTLLRNSRGHDEAISIGPDGMVWSFIADNGAGAGNQRLENLGLRADFVTVGRHSNDALVVMAAQGLTLQYRTETASSMQDRTQLHQRWTPARSVPLPDIAGAVGVRRLYTQTDFSGLRIALIVDTDTPEHGPSYVMACSQWTDNGPGPFILVPPLGAPKPAASRAAPAETGFFRRIALS